MVRPRKETKIANEPRLSNCNLFYYEISALFRSVILLIFLELSTAVGAFHTPWFVHVFKRTINIVANAQCFALFVNHTLILSRRLVVLNAEYSVPVQNGQILFGLQGSLISRSLHKIPF